MDLDILNQYALKFVGIPYMFGGKNPMEGLDCSGLVSEILKAGGILRYDAELSSQDLFDFFIANPNKGSKCLAPQVGAIAFFGGSTDHIGHVAYCLNATLMIEAGGGRPNTLTIQDAINAKAFVKLRRVSYRLDQVAIVMPNYP